MILAVILCMETKICSRCKKELDVSCFYKHKRSKDGLDYWCKSCCKQHNKQYNKDNAPKKAEYNKQYQKNNAPQIAKQKRQYSIDNAPRIAKQKRQYNIDNAPRIAKQKKQYNIDNAPRIAEQKRQYNINNAPQILKQKKSYRKQHENDNALFESYVSKLEVFEEIRCCSENLELLEVKCAYCGKWMKPTNAQTRRRLQAFNGTMEGENRFYCSENCKISCPIYGQHKYPKGFKKATSREVVPLLRQLVLGRDDYTCQKCGATTETAQLHVHHEKSYTLNKIMANDPDNCITLCKDCHNWIHSQEGCKYTDLKC